MSETLIPALAALAGLVVAGLLFAARLSAARATLAGERARRQEAEGELDEAQETIRRLDREQAVAGARVEEARRLIEEQQRFVERTRRELENTFQSLAAAALKGSSEQFLALAEQNLARSRSNARADLDERKTEIRNLLEPLKETLGKLEQRTGEVERARVEAYSRIDSQVQTLAGAAAGLQEQTTTLAAALRGPQGGGKWGEIALRNIAEMAGMTKHCDFVEQTTVEDGGRPDMTVKLPGGRFVAVDAKAPLAAYLEAGEATTEAERNAALDRHVRALRQRVRSLAARDYADSLAGDVDLVVLFLPGDPFLSAAFERDPDLQVDAMRSKVLIATPTTLVALLRTFAVYWQQQSLAENAEQIAAVAQELYERAAKFSEELTHMGRALSQALDAYNRAVGSFERRLLPMGRRLDEMKVAEQTRRRLETPLPIDDEVRRLDR
jgi:DNA recombination protein RmuC